MQQAWKVQHGSPTRWSRSCIAAVRGRKKTGQPEESPASREAEPSIPPPYTAGAESISEGQTPGSVDEEAWDAALVDGTAADQDAADEDYYEEYEESELFDDDGLGEEGEEDVAQPSKGVPRITSAWLDYDDIKAEQDDKKKANPNIMSINEYLRSQQTLADAADAAAEAAADGGELESKAEEAAEAQINIEALARQTSTAMMVTEHAPLAFNRQGYQSFVMDGVELLVSETADGRLNLADCYVFEADSSVYATPTITADIPTEHATYQIVPLMQRINGDFMKQKFASEKAQAKGPAPQHLPSGAGPVRAADPPRSRCCGPRSRHPPRCPCPSPPVQMLRVYFVPVASTNPYTLDIDTVFMFNPEVRGLTQEYVERIGEDILDPVLRIKCVQATPGSTHPRGRGERAPAAVTSAVGSALHGRCELTTRRRRVRAQRGGRSLVQAVRRADITPHLWPSVKGRSKRGPVQRRVGSVSLQAPPNSSHASLPPPNTLLRASPLPACVKAAPRGSHLAGPCGAPLPNPYCPSAATRRDGTLSIEDSHLIPDPITVAMGSNSRSSLSEEEMQEKMDMLEEEDTSEQHEELPEMGDVDQQGDEE
ncbi:MAG: hypothetical protein WDW38_011203 [Sanguina aurantia]